MIKLLEDLKIFHKYYEFLKWQIDLIKKFPKAERFCFTQRISNISLNVLEGIIQSNNNFDKKQALEKTILEIDKLRIFFRLSRDLKFISFSQYEYASKEIDEIGKMVGGWYKNNSSKIT